MNAQTLVGHLHPRIKKDPNRARGMGDTREELLGYAQKAIQALRTDDPFFFVGGFFVNEDAALRILGYSAMQQLIVCMEAGDLKLAEDLGVSDEEIQGWLQVCGRIDHNMKNCDFAPYIRD